MTDFSLDVHDQLDMTSAEAAEPLPQQANAEEEANGKMKQRIASKSGHKIIKMRGLPFSADKAQIKAFFGSGVAAYLKAIEITLTPDGRPTGLAYVEIDGDNAFRIAMSKDGKNMGSRYVELFESSYESMNKELERSSEEVVRARMGRDAVVRLRGLPFRANAKSIREFFEPDAIVAPNDTKSILITTDYDGRPSGEAYVQLADPVQLDKALKKNLQHMEHRYVEVFISSRAEMERALRSEMQFTYDDFDDYGGSPGDMRGLGRGGQGAPRGRQWMADWNDYYPPPAGGRMSSNMRMQAMQARDMRRSRPYANPNSLMGMMSRYSEWWRRIFENVNHQITSDIYDEAYGDPYGCSGFGQPPMGMRGGYGYPPFGGRFGNDGFDYDNPYHSHPAPPMRARGTLTTATPGWSTSGTFFNSLCRNNRPNPGSQVIRMRGLPWSATEEDIEQFFAPLKPSWLRILLNNEGRASGEARVQFADDNELNEALKKDKAYMGGRYIELSVMDIYS